MESDSTPLPSYSHQLTLSRKQAEAWRYLSDQSVTELLYGGGAGSGKSYLGCVWHIYRRTTYAGTRGLIGRAKISNLEQSTLVTYFNVAHLLGYQIGRDFTYNSQKHTINWVNGSQTILKDLFLYPSDPDFISLGSTEFTDAFIDEVNEITEKAFDIVNSRIRYKLGEFGLIPKILMTCNPGPGWVRDKFISKNGHPVKLQPYQKVVKALVTDNPDKGFVDLYSTQLTRMSSDYDRLRLLHGDWDATPSAVNPFLYALNQDIHFDTRVNMDFNKQLFIGIDFNLNPFAVVFANIFRDEAGLHIHFVGELSINNGSVPAMGARIKATFGHQLHNCMLTGDAMGNARNITLADNASNYETLRRILGLRISQIIVPANPTHKQNRNDFNYLLHVSQNPAEKIHVKLNPLLCPGLAQDWRMVQCDAEGSILKKNRSDVTQRADFMDGSRYIINTFVKRDIETHQKNSFGNIKQLHNFAKTYN